MTSGVHSITDNAVPREVRDESAWYGAEIAGRDDWIERLSEAEIAEVESAVRKIEESLTEESNIELATAFSSITRGDGPPPSHGPSITPGDVGRPTISSSITARDVLLPTLGTRLRGFVDEVLNGRGFVLIKGLPVERWTRRQAAISFLLIGAHLGNLRMQNAEGHLLGHVKDVGRSSDDPNTRIYQTRERQTHHTDSCDVVGLLCLRAAKSGGLSSLVSSTTIFNEMRRRRPDLLKVLMDPIETDRRGEVPEGSKPYFTIPVFNYHDGLVSTIYQRQYIESARRFPGVAPLTPQQIEALDLLDQLANDPKLNLMMELQPGDIQLVHNHTILHDRTAFEDYPESERKRHLLRLWLAPPGARRLPEVYAERFGSITPGDRGGVVVPDARPTVPLE